ncbi:MAG: PIG-L family deacetylase [Chloroflexi bacterium]|nr:PIG-L family deacetylase [Chloroflexota bacterium]MBV9600996.1 PIG-L family deacetylase [Chloroflexota bacterium]
MTGHVQGYGSRHTLLAVHAHPDDETITTGGTLARCGAEGVRTIVVTCTTGDLGEVRDPTLLGQDVAALRSAELEAACRVLGVSRLVQLGYGDSGMAGTPENDRPTAFVRADVEQVAARLIAIVDAERPTVMVAYDETGGYGHPDHVRAHEVAVAAYRAAPPAIRPRRLCFVRFPITWSRTFVAALRAAGIDAPGSAPAGADAGPSVAEIGVPDDLVTAAVDVRAYLALKRSALACHASQMPPTHFLRRMPRGLAERVWSHEFFSIEVGESTPAVTDLFEGLD